MRKYCYICTHEGCEYRDELPDHDVVPIHLADDHTAEMRRDWRAESVSFRVEEDLPADGPVV